MPNMDYPGPCPSCSAIEGCSSKASKDKAVASYCLGLEMELGVWKSRLYDVLVAAGDLKTGEMDKVADTLVLIKSTVKELEMIVASMKDSCPGNLADTERKIGGKLDELRGGYTKALEVISPGWFGG